MKKTLGLLALTLAVSSVASAQDFLKSISVDVNSRYQYTDRNEKNGVEETKDGDAEMLGNEGFKQDNRIRTRFNKTISGTVVLSDEHGINADFVLGHRNQTDRAGRERTQKRIKTNQGLTLTKATKLGNLDTTWALGYSGYNERKYTLENQRKANPSSYNEFTFGPSFKAYGVDVNLAAVYAHEKNTGGEDHVIQTLSPKYDEWGVNFGLSKGGAIAKVPFGDITYNIGFDHKLRVVNTEVEAGEDKSNVKLSYTQSVAYNTPSFAGFKAGVSVENEWSRHTTVSGWTNELTVPVSVSYTKAFATPAGKVTVKPYASYSVLSRITEKHAKADKEANVAAGNKNNRTTVEKNEARVGLKVTLDVKN